MKKCDRCGEIKDISMFYVHKKDNKIFSYCKECSGKSRHNSYLKNREKRRAHDYKYQRSPKALELHRAFSSKVRKLYPEKIRCRDKVYKAIKSGKIIRGNCEGCGKPKAQAHHKDYSKPFEIKWLCPACHTKEHLYGNSK